ncbi:protein extra-macrochaetae [Drosophila grimshawi]|uniref:GH15419 n=1 Tax=Drosophila grimshawi TaxID=7222 RepID=B4J2R3_DROGR|nr:protein extra-macrochaetae [Drosophila grimshawi]EDV96054.1 GH15419 [Drosophila grimshawi]
MKSLTAVCQTGASMPAINPNGRITRHAPHRGDGENAEMKMYLSKLKDLVPFMPKNRKLSKLEIIQHVIDYICDLQTELETHPEINNFDAAAALSGVAAAAAVAAGNSEGDDDDDDEEVVEEEEDDAMRGVVEERSEQLVAGSDVLAQRLAAEKISSPVAATRIPLIDRQTPNTILPATAAAATLASTAAPVQQQQQQQQLQLHSSLTTQNSGEKDSRQS